MDALPVLRDEPRARQRHAGGRAGLGKPLALQLLAPQGILLVGGALLVIKPLRWLCAAAELGCLAALLRLWSVTDGGPVALAAYDYLPGITVGVRLDHLGLLFAILGVAMGCLLALPAVFNRDSSPPGLGWLVLAQFGLVFLAFDGRLEGVAVAWGMLVLALSVWLGSRAETPASRRAARAFSAANGAAAALLVAVAVAVQAETGTTAFEAIPVGGLGSYALALLAAPPALALLGLGPLLRGSRSPLGAGFAISAVVVPASGYLLARVYDLAGGRLPSPALSLVLASLAGTVAVGYAAGALWAPDLGAAAMRVLQAMAAMILAAAGLGTALGVVAVVATATSLCLCAALLLAAVDAGGGRLPSGDRGRAAFASLAAVVVALLAGGLPPGFGLRAAQLLAAGALSGSAATAAAGILPQLAALVLVPAGISLLRFTGGARPSRTDATRLALIAVSSGTTALLATAALNGVVAPVVAAALRLTPAELQSGIGATGTELLTRVVVAVVVVAAVATLAGRTRLSGVRLAMPQPPYLLPVEVAVLPRVRMRQALPVLVEAGRAMAAFATSRRGELTATVLGIAGSIWLLLR